MVLFNSSVVIYIVVIILFPENMVISTANNFRYDWVPTPRNRAALVFELKASGSAHMALSDARHPNERMYQVVIGDSSNSMTWLGRGKHGNYLF